GLLQKKDVSRLSFIRIISSAVRLNEISPNTNATDTLKLNKNDKVSLMLQELLGIGSIVSRDISMKFKKFHTISQHTIQENFEYCIKNGISQKTLQKYPEVLADTDIPLKILEIRRIPYDINITTPLLSLPYKRLQTFVDEEFKNNRISSISNLLEVNQSEVCKILARRSFLLSLNLKQLSQSIKLLTDNGITKAEIANDLWVLRYSTNVIKERLHMAKRHNIDTLKTWMVRAQPEIFETYIKRRSDNKLILGNSSLAQYLSDRLECTEEIAKYIMSKHPALQNKSLKKLNEMIDYLFKCGFKPIHICRVPKILLHSVDTTRKRLKELHAKGMHLDSLHILTKSRKQYMQYCESLIKASNKLKSS
ncbi:hypothetical protein NQ315_004919, partial [Exocentrus adspersus]